MSTILDELIIQRHDGQGLRNKDELIAVDPFLYPARFRERFERGSARDGFRLVTVRGLLLSRS
jgi:hypothetical protein